MTETTDVVALLRRGWLRLLVCTLLGVGVAIGVLLLSPQRYTANAYLVITPASDSTRGEAATFSQVFARLADDPSVLAVSPHLASIGVTPAEAGEATDVSASPDVPILHVAGHARRAFRSAEITNFVAQAVQIYANERVADTGFEVRQFVRATPPDEPTWPKPVPILGVGLVVGLVVGVLAALARRPAEADGAPPRRSRP